MRCTKAAISICSGILLGIGMLMGDRLLAAPEVSFTADNIDYDRPNGIVRATGSLTIEQGNVRLIGPTGSYNNVNGQSVLSDGVVLEIGSQRLEARQISGNHRDQFFLLEGDVIYLPSAALELVASAAVVQGAAESIRLSGPVMVETNRGRAIADSAEATQDLITLIDVQLTPQYLSTLLSQYESGEYTSEASQTYATTTPEATEYPRIDIDPATGTLTLYEE